MYSKSIIAVACASVVAASPDDACLEGRCLDDEASTMKTSLLQVAHRDRETVSASPNSIAADVTSAHGRGPNKLGCWSMVGRAGEVKTIDMSTNFPCNLGQPQFVYSTTDKTFKSTNRMTGERCIAANEDGQLELPTTDCDGSAAQQFEFSCDIEAAHMCNGTIKSLKAGLCVEAPEGEYVPFSARAPSLKPCDPSNPMQIWTMQDQLYTEERSKLVEAVLNIEKSGEAVILSWKSHFSRDGDETDTFRRVLLDPSGQAKLVTVWHQYTGYRPNWHQCSEKIYEGTYEVDGEVVKFKWSNCGKWGCDGGTDSLKLRAILREEWKLEDNAAAHEDLLGLRYPDGCERGKTD
eukprot:TRINITY_DN46562_c0_g1_i1.p1 TRINITY_DN46562_c0_g1~~TRINITY_DN46562_c0_g1_i1.p1  ORF type:complete len:350 (-),score=76.86 TRINITY_DN46562_c0_g1_i1:159-1208(-)